MTLSTIPGCSDPGSLSAEERAFMARLLALNAAFEGARAGVPAQGLVRQAQAVDALLERYYAALFPRNTEAPWASSRG
ncbi:MAG: hypothetical protein WHV61_04755 [Burkholderiales bacterium]